MIAFFSFPVPFACKATVYDAIRQKDFTTVTDLYEKSGCHKVKELTGYFSYAFYRENNLALAHQLATNIPLSEKEDFLWHRALVSFEFGDFKDAKNVACGLHMAKARSLCSILSQLVKHLDEFQKVSGKRMVLYYHQAISADDARVMLQAMERRVIYFQDFIKGPPASMLTVWVMPDSLFDEILQTPQAEAMSLNNHLFLQHPRDLGRARTLSATMNHELVHALLYAKFRAAIPIWFNEGLAQVLSGEEITDELRQAELKARRLSESYPFQILGRPWKDKDLDLKLAYAQSRLAVEHLIDVYGFYPINQYLKLLKHSDDPEQAFASVFGMDYRKLRLEISDEL